MSKERNITTIEDAIRYWRECVDDAESASDLTVVAGWIVGIMSYAFDSYDEWYEADKDFRALFEAAAALEIENPKGDGGTGDMSFIDEKWEQIKALLARLEDRYQIRG